MISNKEKKLNKTIKKYDIELKALFKTLSKSDKYNDICFSEKLGFIYKDEHYITNPFKDNCYMAEVNPVEYYSQDFINSSLADFMLDYTKSLHDEITNRKELRELITLGDDLSNKKAQQHLEKIMMRLDNPLLLKEARISYRNYKEETNKYLSYKKFISIFEKLCTDEKIK